MQEEVVEREDYKNKKNGIIKNGHDYQYYILPLLTLLPKKYNLKLLEFKIVIFLIVMFSLSKIRGSLQVEDYVKAHFMRLCG